MLAFCKAGNSHSSKIHSKKCRTRRGMTLDEFKCEGARRRASRGRCVAMSERRVVLAGGSGFLGRALAEEFLRAGYETVVLTRKAAKSSARVRHVMWDGRSVGEWARELEGAAAGVNLAG